MLSPLLDWSTPFYVSRSPQRGFSNRPELPKDGADNAVFWWRPRGDNTDGDGDTFLCTEVD